MRLEAAHNGPYFNRPGELWEKPAPEPQEWVDGTFSLELIHLANGERGPDILFTFPWSSATNRYGLTGTDLVHAMRATGVRSGDASSHGSMSPWTIRRPSLCLRCTR